MNTKREAIKEDDIEYFCNACGESNIGADFDDGKLLPCEGLPESLRSAFNEVWGEGMYGYAMYIGKIKGRPYIFQVYEVGDLDEQKTRDVNVLNRLCDCADLLAEHGKLHGSRVFIVEDCDSEFCQWECIVATPVEPTCPTQAQMREIGKEMDRFFNYDYICPKEGNIDMNRKREFFVDTPLGKLHVYAKHDPLDCPLDFPGVYVDLIPPYTGAEPVMLACTEYVSHDDLLQTCVYADAADDSPTTKEVHKLDVPYEVLVQRIREEQRRWKQSVCFSAAASAKAAYELAPEIFLRESVLNLLENGGLALTEDAVKKLLLLESPLQELVDALNGKFSDLSNENGKLFELISKFIEEVC